MRLDGRATALRRALWIGLSFALLCGCASGVGAEAYDNPQFGFGFGFPAGAVRCAPDPSTGPEHGTIIWLDARGGECNYKLQRPKIIVSGNYNAMFWAGPEVALQHDCTADQLERPRLELKGYASAVCQVLRPDGWINVELAAMAGAWPKPETAPRMLYTIILSTTRERLSRDLDRMRAVIESFKVFPPR